MRAPTRAGAYPGFFMKHEATGRIITPPGWDVSLLKGYPPAVYRRYPFMHLGEERQCGVK